MAPVTAFAAALLLSVSSAPAPEVRAAVEVAAPRHASAPRAQEAAASTATDTIAVTAFENITGAAEDDWIGVGIAETLAADVATGGALSVGLTPTEAGRESGARWVITGAYQRVGDQLRITARVVEVATDAVVHTAMVDGPMSELFALQDQLSAELSRGLTASSANATSPAAPTTTTDNAPANTAVTPSSRPAVSTTAGADGGGLAVAPAGFIDGPPPPVAPETIARDAAGRATVRAVLLDEPLQVDGELNEAIYDTVPPVSDFIQQLPDVGEPATERTDTWIFYDAQNVYVAARNWDSAPESQWVANEMQRDSFQLINNDSFSVGFDTFYDRRNGFIFMVNPIGGIFDFQITDEGNPNTDWNPVWDVQTGRFDGGWTVEMEIPFKSIRFRPGTSQIWGLQIGRNVRWKNEWTYLTPVPISGGPGMFRLSAAGTLTGVEVPEGNRTFEIKPYGIGSMATDVNAVPLVSNAGDGDFGLDVKYGVTQNLTADFTYNTDFAQVEVDEQQVNLTRFSLFFPEKREFFLEGRGIFDFGRGVTFGGMTGPGGGGLLWWRQRPDHLLQPKNRSGRWTDRTDSGRRPADRQGGRFQRRGAEHPDGRCGEHGRRVDQLHRRAAEARHPATEPHRRHLHRTLGVDGGRRVERGVWPRRRILVLRQRQLERVLRPHTDTRAGGRRRKLPGGVHVQRGPLCPGG